MNKTKLQPTKRSAKRLTAQWISRLVLPLIIPALFFCFTLWLSSSLPDFEFDPDEGGNLIKALLLDQGYQMYSQIWSDQPPFFTHILAAVIHFAGYDVHNGRILVLFSSCLLLWSAFLYLQMAGGKLQAFIGALTISVLPNFLSLSYSVMIGLPAIALAMISLAALTAWHRNHSTLLLIISSLFIGFSVFTKSFTAFLAPIFFFGIVLALYHKGEAESPWKRYWPAMIWLIVFATTLIGMMWLMIGFDNIQSLFETHLLAQDLELYEGFTLFNMIGNLWPLFPMALAGSIIAVWRRQWLLLYAIVWATVAALMLAQHKPVRYHQILLVSIPAAMIVPSAAEGCWRLLQALMNKGFFNWRGALALFLITGFVGGATIQLQKTWGELNDRIHWLNSLDRTVWDWQMASEMAFYVSQTQWVVTDRPMFAFRFKLPVPPETAVMSEKRRLTTDINVKLLETIREVQPELVVLGRFPWPQLIPYLQEHYRLVFLRPGRSLFVRSDVADPIRTESVKNIPGEKY